MTERLDQCFCHRRYGIPLLSRSLLLFSLELSFMYISTLILYNYTQTYVCLSELVILDNCKIMDSTQYPPEYLAEDQSQRLIILAITFAVLETLFIGLFSISRYINNTAYGMDTYLMYPAFIMCVSHAVLDIRKQTHVKLHNFNILKTEI